MGAKNFQTWLLKHTDRCTTEGRGKEKGVVVRYIHVSHRLKIGNKDVKVVVSVPNCLSSLCKASYHQATKAGCTTKHRESLVECANNVVFALLLTCGKKYIGQTGRHMYIRMQEHANNVRNVDTGNPCKNCRCTAQFSQCYIVASSAKQLTQATTEAVKIAKLGDTCVSAPSIDLTNKAINYPNCML